MNYLIYLSYPPLFISGPISSFNAFISYQQKNIQNYDLNYKIKYLLKIVLYYVSFEIYSHSVCSFSLIANKENKELLKDLSLPILGGLGLTALIFVWFKFLIIWRFARCWALFDGVDVIENMNRCMCNNYCFE